MYAAVLIVAAESCRCKTISIPRHGGKLQRSRGGHIGSQLRALSYWFTLDTDDGDKKRDQQPHFYAPFWHNTALLIPVHCVTHKQNRCTQAGKKMKQLGLCRIIISLKGKKKKWGKGKNNLYSLVHLTSIRPLLFGINTSDNRLRLRRWLLQITINPDLVSCLFLWELILPRWTFNYSHLSSIFIVDDFFFSANLLEIFWFIGSLLDLRCVSARVWCACAPFYHVPPQPA